MVLRTATTPMYFVIDGGCMEIAECVLSTIRVETGFVQKEWWKLERFSAKNGHDTDNA